MAKGDVVAGMSNLTAGAKLSIQPGSGLEWIIHNIYHAADAELYIVEGSNELLFASSGAKGSWSAYFLHLTDTHYLKVKNTNAASKLVSYDGIVSK